MRYLVNVDRLKDNLSEMSSNLTVKEKELTRHKEDKKLLIKHLRIIREKCSDIVTQVRIL